MWIDNACGGLSSRLVRNLALAEVFKRANVPDVTIACRKRRKLPSELEKRGIHWLNSEPENGPLSLSEIIDHTSPQLVLTESETPVRLRSSNNVIMHGLTADSFSEDLFLSETADTVILPGWIVPPEFDTLGIPPSRLGDCLHGGPYVSLPELYRQPLAANREEDRILITVAGDVTPEMITPIIESVKACWEGLITLLADVSPAVAQPIRDRFESEFDVMTDASLRKRFNAIEQSRLVITTPTCALYEFLVQGKPMILLHRTEREKRLCRTIEEETSARTAAVEGMALLKRHVNELVRDESTRKELGENAAGAIDKRGAERLVLALLKRYAVCIERRN